MKVFLVILLTLGSVLGVLVETEYGTVQGQTVTLIDDYHAGISINSFYAVPFARAPVDELRFEPPEEPEPWEGVFEADTLGPACSQSNVSIIQYQHPDWNNYDEDCLHMNIWAPTDESGGPYPVMVFYYGGSYQQGGNVQYTGHFLAARGVVVVIPNYRLGVFGFAYTGDGIIQGNMGLMDQAASLLYIQENIAAYGGDPDMVTIFGQSAGASSVGMQAYFIRPSSGTEFAHWGLNEANQEPEEYIKQTAEQVDCPVSDSQEMVDCLKTKAREELEETTMECKEGYSCLGMVPVVDGPGGYIPDTPQNLRKRGEFNHVPEMVGYTMHDGFIWAWFLGPEMWFGGPNRTEFQVIIRRQVASLAPQVPDAENREEDIYQAMDFYFTPWPHINVRSRNRHALGEINTDINYGYTAESQARYHVEYAPVYQYIFNYVSENTTDAEWMGCIHSGDLAYNTGWSFIRHNPEVRLETEIVDTIGYMEEDDAFAYYTMELWTNFAKFGNPTPEPVTPPGGLDPSQWLPYSNEQLNYMYLGREAAETIEDYRQHAYAFWREYMPYLMYRDDEMPDKNNPSKEACHDKKPCLSFKDAFYNRVDKLFQFEWQQKHDL